jgi:hypothetical protein
VRKNSTIFPDGAGSHSSRILLQRTWNIHLALLPILNDGVLLSKLKELVMLEGDDTMHATGIPPHV